MNNNNNYYYYRIPVHSAEALPRENANSLTCLKTKILSELLPNFGHRIPGLHTTATTHLCNEIVNYVLHYTDL